jgi:hypothetical protein
MKMKLVVMLLLGQVIISEYQTLFSFVDNKIRFSKPIILYTGIKREIEKAMLSPISLEEKNVLLEKLNLDTLPTEKRQLVKTKLQSDVIFQLALPISELTVGLKENLQNNYYTEVVDTNLIILLPKSAVVIETTGDRHVSLTFDGVEVISSLEKVKDVTYLNNAFQAIGLVDPVEVKKGLLSSAKDMAISLVKSDVSKPKEKKPKKSKSEKASDSEIDKPKKSKSEKASDSPKQEKPVNKSKSEKAKDKPKKKFGSLSNLSNPFVKSAQEDKQPLLAEEMDRKF